MRPNPINTLEGSSVSAELLHTIERQPARGRLGRVASQNIPEKSPDRPRKHRAVLRWVAIALLYFVCGAASVRTFWLPCGLALAAFLLSEKRQWPLVAGAIFAGEALYNQYAAYAAWPWWATWSISVTNVVAPGAGALLCLRFTKVKLSLNSIGQLTTIIGLGAMIPLLVPAALGGYLSLMMGSKRDFYTIWNGWYLRDLLGVLMVTPLAIAWCQPVGQEDRWFGSRHRWEALALLACACGISAIGYLLDESRFGVVRLAAIPILLWSSLRFGVRGASAFTLLLALAWGWMSLRNPGAGAKDVRSIAIHNLDLQCTVASMVFIGLVPAIIVQLQRKAEKLLITERNFFRSALDQQPEGVFVSDFDGALLDINGAGLRLIGLDSITAARGVDVEQQMESQFRAEHRLMLKTVREGGEHLHEFLLNGPAGQERLIECRSVPLRAPEGHVYAILSVWRDISKERQFQNELKVARFTVDRAAVALFWIRSDGSVVDTNAAACRLLGYTRSELLTLHSRDLLDAEFSEERWPQFWRAVAVERFADFESGLRHKDGRLIQAEVRTHYIDLDLGGEHRELLCVFLSDVTERKRAAEAIRRSEERLALIFGSVAEGIVVYDGAGKMVEANPAASKIFGMSLSDVDLQAPGTLHWRFLHENDGPGDGPVDPIFHTIRTGNPSRGAVRRIMRGDGSNLLLLISAVPLSDEAGQVRLVIGSLADITAQRSLQDQLRQSQKMEIFGQLAGGIAHDFNNILTAMGISLHLLEWKVGFSPEAANFINDLRSMTKRAGGLTEQLLLFARRRVVQMEKIDLNASIKGLMKILSPALGERITLRMETSPAPVWIEGDSGMIDQILMNLCVNSRDAIATAGVITVATGTGEVDDPAKLVCRLGRAKVGRYGVLRVSDTGMGMTQEVLARIFEPFFTTKDTGQGTGLGLATVHGIVEQHQGWATVDSVVGHGTVFSVYFPLSDSPTSSPEPRVESVKGTGETILFVEDEISVRTVCALLLRKTGYRVLEAANASEALDVWSRHSAEICLLVTDMVMPGGMTGLDLISRVREEKRTLSAILTSGYNNEILKAGQFTALGVDWLAKPYDIDSLTRLIGQKVKLQALSRN